MHAMRRHTVHLLRQLLSKTLPLHPMPVPADDLRLLLSKAIAAHFVLPRTLLSGQLLPKAVPAILLAREQPTQLLSAGLQCSNPGSNTAASKTAAVVC
jgi:hypothetical protein